MKTKLKLLKSWMQTTTLNVITALVLFTEPLSAGWIRDGIDNTNLAHPQRMVQVDFGITNNDVDNHPNATVNFVQVALADENMTRTYMSNNLAQIDTDTHIQFWLSNDPDTQINHHLRALFGAAGAQENAYISAINRIAHGAQIVPATVTFSLHNKIRN